MSLIFFTWWMLFFCNFFFTWNLFNGKSTNIEINIKSEHIVFMNTMMTYVIKYNINNRTLSECLVATQKEECFNKHLQKNLLEYNLLN